MKIGICSDHAGLEYKTKLISYLLGKGYEVVNFGTDSPDSCDYSDFGILAARAVASGECERGVVLCTTGIGMCMTANKVKGIRCALLSDLMSARLTRQHNDANMIAMGAAVLGEKLALEILDVFLTTDFEGGRHQRRIDKFMALENE